MAKKEEKTRAKEVEEEDLDEEEQDQYGELDPDAPLAKPLVEVEEELEQKKIQEAKKSQTAKAPRPADDRKKVPVYIDGREQRRKRAVDIGLSEKILPPWTKGVTAVYRLLSSTRIDPATKKPPEDKDVSLPGSYMLFDKWESDPLKKKKLMRNLGRPKIENDKEGNQKVVDQIENIDFSAGTKRVDVSRDYRLYIFMELHPLNMSNPNRDQNNPGLFERVDVKNLKSPASAAAELDLAFEAEGEVMKMKNQQELIGFAVSAGVFSPGMSAGEAKNELRAFARRDPRKFFRLIGDTTVAIKLNVLTAMTFGILDYKQDQRSFFFVETEEKIFTHLVNEEAYDAITVFLGKPENKGINDELIRLVDYWQ